MALAKDEEINSFLNILQKKRRKSERQTEAPVNTREKYSPIVFIIHTVYAM